MTGCLFTVFYPMEVLATVLTVILVITAILMIAIILMQSNRASGAGIFGSASQTAFGAGSADALTKITGGFAATFMILALLLALIKSRKPDDSKIQSEIPKAAVTTPVAPAANTVTPGAATTAPATNSTAPVTTPAAPATTPAQPATPK